MRAGECKEGEHVLRAKIDMASPNINLRDPTLYRIKHESHQATGEDWCIYPMYDFSHPIADAMEGITHSLCTLEFEDHRPFYDWVIEKLFSLSANLLPPLPENTNNAMARPRPQQIEFSRLNIQHTVLSKRKLIQLVEQKHVSGWDDPRLPTLSGIRRRGVPPGALRLFCERVGISKTDSNIAYSNLEDCVRLEMDDLCRRAFCVLKPLQVTITNWEQQGTCILYTTRTTCVI
jgi:glutaminyl-tRNA synthetase